MIVYRAGPWLAVIFGLCAVAGCAGKSPEQVEAERAKANAEWNAQAASAERLRQAEENRMVQQEIAAHQQREQADQQREEERQAHVAEQERLVQMVARRFPDPAAVSVTDVRWNNANTGICGNVSGHGAGSPAPEPVAFVASGAEATLDIPAQHDAFVAAARSVDCPR